MPRPKRLINDKEINIMATDNPILNAGVPAVKQIVRYITRGMPDHERGMFLESEVSAYLSSWVEQGYTLRFAFKLDEAPEGAIGMMYILTRND